MRPNGLLMRSSNDNIPCSVRWTAIMNHQYEFFLTGDETKLKPMILKDIAEKTGLDISTVSRVANSKFVQTEFGTYRLNSSSVNH